MAKAKAIAIQKPMVAVALDGTVDVMKSTVKGGQKAVSLVMKGTSKGFYRSFYYLSFGVTFASLLVLEVIGNNPLASGIKDGAVAAVEVRRKQRTKKGK